MVLTGTEHEKAGCVSGSTREVCSGWSVRICVVWGLGLGGAGGEVKEFVWGGIL